MSVAGKRRYPSVIEAAIAARSGIKEITAETFRSDAAAILESLVGEWDEETILVAMTRQGFDAKAYGCTLRSLVKIARRRRQERMTGVER